MQKKVIKVPPGENVAVALIDVWKDNVVQVEQDEVKLLTDTNPSINLAW